MEKNNEKKQGKVYELAQMAVMTAVICVLSPLALPIGPVPISLATFAVMLTAYLLGWQKGTISVLIFMLIGVVGVPVFSGFTGGFAKLVGPTGGYIVGYIPMAIVTGLFVEKSDKKVLHIVGMVLGCFLCYVLGTAWFCYEAGAGLQKALMACVVPFIPGDLLKIVIVMVLGPLIRKALKKAGLLK